MLQNRYKSQLMHTFNYITKRLCEGFKLECQMYTTGINLRNMLPLDTIDINNLWYEHTLECGIEFQISFDFVAQRFNSITLLPEVYYFINYFFPMFWGCHFFDNLLIKNYF